MFWSATGRSEGHAHLGCQGNGFDVTIAHLNSDVGDGRIKEHEWFRLTVQVDINIFHLQIGMVLCQSRNFIQNYTLSREVLVMNEK